MKKFTYISTLILGMLMILGSQLQAQSPTSALKGIEKAIVAGDAEALGAYFNTSVDVTVPSSDKSYSSQQATFVIKEFFTNSGVKEFESMHEGQSGATYYSTGVLTTSKGEFDTNIFLKKIGEKYLITQIRFEK